MQKTLMVNGVECKTKVIDGFWYVIINGEPEIIYRKKVKTKNRRYMNGLRWELKRKSICQVCEREFFGRLSDSKGFCGLSCFGKVNGKINIEKLHSKRSELTKNGELKIKAGSFISSRIANGKIIRPEVCSNCGVHGSIVFHHPNYNKINEGMWLCIFCHRKLHFGHNINGKLTTYSISM